MQRLTARFLLLFALFGTFVPAALQALSEPSHACCLRKAAQHCHHKVDSERAAIHSTECCTNYCGRAVTVSQEAKAQPAVRIAVAEHSGDPVSETRPLMVPAEFRTSKSPRGPPNSALV